MKTVLLVLLTWVPAALFAGDIAATDKITAVTVYSDRARITRVAEVDLPAGENVIRFSGLPVALEDSSVQASGKGTSGLKILGIEVRSVLSEKTVNDRVREIQTELDQLGDQRSAWEIENADLTERKVFLNKVRDSLTVPAKEAAAAPSMQNIRPLYDFYAAELKGLGDRSLVIARELRALTPKEDLLRQELARLSGGGAKATKDVLVAVRADRPSRADISLGYNMRNASWTPVYDARLDSKSQKIELTYQGIVRQQTGENWDNVKLSLSTARPNVGARMPELSPWWLRIQEILPASASMPPAPMMRNEMSARKRDQVGAGQAFSGDLAEMKEEAPLEMETAEIKTDGFSAVFEIKVPSTIPADGESHKVTIATQVFDGKLEYVATPKLSETAYLRARLTNSTGAPILGGEVNLFRDGDFVGRSRVNFIAPAAEFDFYLGGDDGVKITRKTLLDKTSRSGLIQKKETLEKKFETTLESFKETPVKVTVLDQLPVSQDASVVVSNVQFSQQPGSLDKETGKIEWVLDLKPKEKKVITSGFTVEWPEGKNVQGL